jgi:endonuclease YncB( thermonuclease family)
MPIDTPPAIIGIASVIDGDTIEIHGQKIRLWGIDAPESAQLCKSTSNIKYRCGQQSATYLSNLLKSHPINCKPKSFDRYQRIIAKCFLFNDDISAIMVKNGQAVAYLKYSREYTQEQTTAKSYKIGIWQGTFLKPWTWRAYKKAHKNK